MSLYASQLTSSARGRHLVFRWRAASSTARASVCQSPSARRHSSKPGPTIRPRGSTGPAPLWPSAPAHSTPRPPQPRRRTGVWSNNTPPAPILPFPLRAAATRCQSYGGLPADEKGPSDCWLTFGMHTYHLAVRGVFASDAAASPFPAIHSPLPLIRALQGVRRFADVQQQPVRLAEPYGDLGPGLRSPSRRMRRQRGRGVRGGAVSAPGVLAGVPIVLRHLAEDLGRTSQQRLLCGQHLSVSSFGGGGGGGLPLHRQQLTPPPSPAHRHPVPGRRSIIRAPWSSSPCAFAAGLPSLPPLPPPFPLPLSTLAAATMHHRLPTIQRSNCSGAVGAIATAATAVRQLIPFDRPPNPSPFPGP